MGIDTIIHYGCVPKEMLTTQGLLDSLKAGDRAQAIIDFYRTHGDHRPIEEMGGELMRRSAAGEEEIEVVLVKDLLAQKEDLKNLAHYCEGCPANSLKRPFGCIGHISYPISQLAEAWLLARLPSAAETMPFMLLNKAEEFGFTGETARSLRQNNPGVIFEGSEALFRRYHDSSISGDQLFELFFLLGDTLPIKRMFMILMFMGAVRRDLPANELMALTPPPDNAAERVPFLIEPSPEDDASIRDFKSFFRAVYDAYLLNREILLDV